VIDTKKETSLWNVSLVYRKKRYNAIAVDSGIK